MPEFSSSDVVAYSLEGLSKCPSMILQCLKKLLKFK